MSFTPLVAELMEALRCLPGVGARSAQRMALSLLRGERESGRQLARVLAHAMEQVGHCQQCRIFSEQLTCDLCRHPKRATQQLCVVESPADVFAIEQTGAYFGRYFVLLGHLSPLDGIGPQEIGIDQFSTLLKEQPFEEVILATNATVEGEATAHYLAEIVKRHGKIASRIAHGVPLGGELEYVDGGTLAQAFAGRRAV
jgi:recombination protein RecR